jgi:integrase/recombinase XerD
MTTRRLDEPLGTYLALRRALGFPLRPEERLLRDFLAFVEKSGPVASGYGRIALAWATATGARCGARAQTRRLGVVRAFLAYVHADDPDVDVPGPGLLRHPQRHPPHIYARGEIADLMRAAYGLGPRDSLRPHTIATLIGLMVSCGLRASEALKLTVADVDLEVAPPRMLIRQTKFHKSRLVPLHPTTAEALRTYAECRRRLGYDGLCDRFFVSERGTPMQYHATARTFVALVRRLGLRGPAGEKGACLHHLRHTFAVTRLATWASMGTDVRDRLPHLSVYLGHARPEDTYWYLSATPQTLDPAAARFDTYARGGGPS